VSASPSTTEFLELDRAADRAAQALGREFLFALHTAARALRLYPLENRAVQNSLADLEEVVERVFTSEGGLHFRYVGDFCFVNDLRLRLDLSSFATFASVVRLLKRHAAGQLEVFPGATRADWVATLSLLLDDPSVDHPFASLVERLGRSGVSRIHLSAETASDSIPDDQSREAARQTYAQSVAVAREALLGVRLGKGVSVRRVKRAVQKVVDQVLHNESSILSMTVLRSYDQYTFAHSVNVCIFAVALGKKIGLSRGALYELGMSALMHDVGKVRLPIELTTKTGALEDAEWETMKEHPTEGLLALLELRGHGDFPLRGVLSAYEHHMKMDQTGYPRSVRKREPSLSSRIVAIADGFDAGTSKRSYQSVPWLPDAVLKEMRDNPHRGFDPLLVKAFISMTGIYPVGSLVILDSYELGVVVAPATDPEQLSRPIVRVTHDELGIPLEPPRTIDLSEMDPTTGAPARTIIKTTDPEQYGIRVQDYIV
jgi:HD-GYP domain-containing protein (c-di-GMP phosphodiesterase class II)